MNMKNELNHEVQQMLLSMVANRFNNNPINYGITDIIKDFIDYELKRLYQNKDIDHLFESIIKLNEAENTLTIDFIEC